MSSESDSPENLESNAAAAGLPAGDQQVGDQQTGDQQTGDQQVGGQLTANQQVGDQQDGPRDSESSTRDSSGQIPWGGWGELAVGAVSVLSLVVPIVAAGLWDPYELDVVEQSRRIGATILGDASLAVEGANNEVPTLEELGRGQLPFTVIAVGLKLFGLRDWGARAPLAVCALIGVLATYWVVRRLASRRAAVYAGLILATTPLYFVHARSALGDIVTMSAVAVALSGLCLAVFDDRLSTRRRVVAWSVGSVGLLAGFAVRGLPLGVAVPALGVGVGWLLTRSSPLATSGLAGSEPNVLQRSGDEPAGRTDKPNWAQAMGALSLGIGLAAAAVAAWALQRLPAGAYSMLIGSAVDPLRELPTHDQFVQHIAYAFYPYSALLPGAAAAVLLRPRATELGDLGLRVSMLTTAVLGFGAYTLMAPGSGLLPFGAPAAGAALVALFLCDLRGLEAQPDSSAQDDSEPQRDSQAARVRDQRWLPALGLCSAALLVLMALDFRQYPDKVLSVFSFAGAKVPAGFELQKYFFGYAGLVAALVLFAALYDAATPRADRIPSWRRWFNVADHLTWLRFVRRGYGERLFYVLLTSALAAVGLLAVRGIAWLRPAWLGNLARVELVMFFGEWGLPLLLGFVLAPSLTLLARDVSRLVFALLPWRRSTTVAAVLLAVAGALSLGYYPALAAELSPRSVFEAFRNHKKPGEPLGMIGAQAVSARYYADAQVVNLSSVPRALDWLVDGTGPRRWLVLREKELARLNAKYRERVAELDLPLANLPVVDSASSEVLLATSELPPGETNHNPLEKWLPLTRPTPSRSVDVNFAGQLECLGWEITDSRGKPVERVKRDVDYVLTFFYEVKAPVTGKWMTFIHIDGEGKRINGDHETLDGKYPFSLWRPGDFIADRYDLNIRRSYPAGNYTVYFGLFAGEKRLSVSRGPHKDDRVRAGTFRLY